VNLASYTSLLHDMRQLMGQQSIAVAGAGSVPACSEDNMIAHRIGKSIDRRSRIGCARVIVYSNIAEIVAETGLECCSRGLGEGMAMSSEHILHN